jgi:PAS domain S-box-containing protein
VVEEPGDVSAVAERLRLALRDSDGRFQWLVDSLHIGVLIQGPRSEVVFANAAAARLLGMPASELIGKTSLDASPLVIHEDGTPFPGEDHPAPQVLATGKPVRDVVMGFYRPPAKDRAWLLVNADPQLGPDGRVEQMVCTFSDVTASRDVTERLRESERRYRQLVEKAPDIIYRTDIRGHFTYVNPAASRVMGYADSELVGRHYLDLVRQDYRASVEALLVDQFRRRVPGTYAEFVAVTKSGQEVWIAQNVELLVEGDRVQGFQAVARDITERKEAEEFLVRAREAAVEASRLKSEFVANVSHELRNPLNGVIGMATLLLGTGLREDQRDYAQTIERSGRDLLEIIDDILAFSKAEAGSALAEEMDFDLRQVVEETVRPLAARAAARGVAMSTLVADEVPSAVRGDAGKLRQALSHLVGNAVKFTAAGTVVVRVELVADTPPLATLRFEVADTGIGIAPEAHERIFLPFFQVDGSPARTYGGAGLGLAIAKRMAEALGGDIGMRSRPGEGSAFWFTARVSTSSGASMEAEPETAAARAATRVLVAEDNAVNRKVVASLLEGLGYRVEVATNGAEAVEACRRSSYDLVLMDRQMPEMDGLRATVLIREHEGTSRRTPIVALTASALAGERERCLDAGMDDYLTKPVRLQVLDATIRKWTRGGAAAGARPSPAAHHPMRALEAQRGPAVALEVLDLFLQSTPLRLAEMRDAFLREDARALENAAHSLKGAAAQMGARGMADVCSQVAAVCRTAAPAAARELLDALEAEWRSERAAFEGEQARLKGSGAVPRRTS